VYKQRVEQLFTSYRLFSFSFVNAMYFKKTEDEEDDDNGEEEASSIGK